MSLFQLTVNTPGRSAKYKILVDQGTLAQAGNVARKVLGEPATRAAVISNARVFSLYGGEVLRSLKKDFRVRHWLMGDGERFKSIRTAENALAFLASCSLDRTDCVIALGGGVVGDLAGFAAATYMRGIPLIQIPTTLLAQVDSSVGGKTAVNMRSAKNLIGSFHQPSAVIIDTLTLGTLPARELTSGLCELLKQGAVSGRPLFLKTTDFLRRFRSGGTLISPVMTELIASHIAFKAEIVANDEREESGRTDRRSRKILNFGHTVGHALETVTKYRKLRHGEAVGHGILAAAVLSRNVGLLKQSELELLQQGLHLCGQLPPVGGVDEKALIEAISHDKKRSAGNLQWVLLERIGRPRIVSEKEIGPTAIRKSLREALELRSSLR